MQNKLLENLVVYKKASALFAASQLGLFRKIEEHGCLNKKICCQIGWNERYVELLCIYLSGEGYLFKSNRGWHINKEFEKLLDVFEEISEHERNLYFKWLSPDIIVSSIQSKDNERIFDRDGFTIKEQEIYNNTMYGKNVNLLGIYLLRKMKKSQNNSTRCLVYGRSNEQVHQVLKKYITEIIIDFVSLDQNIDNKFSYDLILIYNTIHYKESKEWKKIFIQMKKALKKNGIMCIADVFYRSNNIFQSTVLMDWITHGGGHYIYRNEIVEHLHCIGFERIEQQFIDSISIDLLFVYK